MILSYKTYYQERNTPIQNLSRWAKFVRNEAGKDIVPASFCIGTDVAIGWA